MGKQLQILSCLLVFFVWVGRGQRQPIQEENFAFQEAPPGEAPPQVLKPPYTYTDVICPGLENRPQDLEFNICGDLNRGFIPLNPMGQQPLGMRYPFSLLRNKTLDFLRKSLPILKEDPRLPKVTKYNGPIAAGTNLPLPQPQLPPQPQPLQPVFQSLQPFSSIRPRQKRSSQNDSSLLTAEATQNSTELNITNEDTARSLPPELKDLCGDSSNMLCRVWGMISTGLTGLSGPKPNLNRNGVETTNEVDTSGILTPCPSMSEYVAPVFARNFRGLWRYIIQIPQEGYFTQSVEVTKCINQKCKFMDGACLSSTRWVSLLAAELFYPNMAVPRPPPVPAPTPPPRHFDIPMPPVYDFQNFQQYLNVRAGMESTQKLPTQQNLHVNQPLDQQLPEEKLPTCDGMDQQGCFQIRVFYDWFLIPGACKCWRPTGRQVLLHK